MERIILAHSGGFRTSVGIPWLSETYRANVIAVTVDLGQRKELDAVHERALALGAARAHVIDAREEFLRHFALPAMQAGAGDDGSPRSTALGRPLIAKHVVEIARIEGAATIAHGCVEGSADARRFEQAVGDLNGKLKIVSLSEHLRWSDTLGYAASRGLSIPTGVSVPASVDLNLWGRTVEVPVPTDELPNVSTAYVLTRSPAAAPDAPACVEIQFDRGFPVRVNGVAMPLLELVQSLETIAAAHGVGRIDLITPGRDGQRVCVIYEAPAAVVLQAAHAALQQVVIDPAPVEASRGTGWAYAGLIEDGLWFTPTREVLNSVVSHVQSTVTGETRLRLHKGECRVERARARTRERSGDQGVPASDRVGRSAGAKPPG